MGYNYAKHALLLLEFLFLLNISLIYPIASKAFSRTIYCHCLFNRSVRRSIRGGSQLLNKRGGTYRLNENVKENGFIPGMSGMSMVNSMQVLLFSILKRLNSKLSVSDL
jgi:hypothetical protein